MCVVYTHQSGPACLHFVHLFNLNPLRQRMRNFNFVPPLNRRQWKRSKLLLIPSNLVANSNGSGFVFIPTHTPLPHPTAPIRRRKIKERAQLLLGNSVAMWLWERATVLNCTRRNRQVQNGALPAPLSAFATIYPASDRQGNHLWPSFSSHFNRLQ